jgi:hypothetical protein
MAKQAIGKTNARRNSAFTSHQSPHPIGIVLNNGHCEWIRLTPTGAGECIGQLSRSGDLRPASSFRLAARRRLLVELASILETNRGSPATSIEFTHPLDRSIGPLHWAAPLTPSSVGRYSNEQRHSFQVLILGGADGPSELEVGGWIIAALFSFPVVSKSRSSIAS